jgi:hypothetical protein
VVVKSSLQSRSRHCYQDNYLGPTGEVTGMISAIELAPADLSRTPVG